MRCVITLIALCVLGAAQTGTVYPLPISQNNSPGATLVASGTVGPMGGGANFQGTVVGGPSATLISELFIGGIPPRGGPDTVINLGLSGPANAPFALIASVEISTFNCIVPAPNPNSCPQGPWMPSALATPFGTYHAGFPFIPVLDGIGIGIGGSVSANLNPLGAYILGATVPWSSSASYWPPENWAVQALVADPAAPSGFLLSAAFSNAKWTLNCLLCPTPPPGG